MLVYVSIMIIFSTLLHFIELFLFNLKLKDFLIKKEENFQYYFIILKMAVISLMLLIWLKLIMFSILIQLSNEI